MRQRSSCSLRRQLTTLQHSQGPAGPGACRACRQGGCCSRQLCLPPPPRLLLLLLLLLLPLLLPLLLFLLRLCLLLLLDLLRELWLQHLCNAHLCSRLGRLLPLLHLLALLCCCSAAGLLLLLLLLLPQLPGSSVSSGKRYLARLQH